MCQTYEVYGEPLTDQEVMGKGLSGYELIVDASGNTVGRRYYKWYESKS